MSVHSSESEPETGIPAEAVFEALLAAQHPVPVAATATPVGAPAPTQPTAAPTVPVPPGAVLLKGPALKLSQNMEASLAIPTATSFRDLPVRTLELRRADLNARLKAAGRSEKLSFTHLIAWALVQAGRAFPVMNHAVLHSGAETYKLVPPHLNLGLAVDVERKDGSRGLVVPVLKQADTLDFAAFLATYEGLVAKARTNKLMPDDFAGATITLTNPGGLGTVGSVPRLMQGQGTIIATGSIAWPVEFAATPAALLQQLGLSKVMTVTSTYDHRVIQGAESGSFLRLLDQFLQGEQGFYEGIYTALGLGTPAALPTPAASLPVASVATSTAGGVDPRQVAAAMALVKAIRSRGHMAARLDPLGSTPVGDPSLDPTSHGLTPEQLAALPADIFGIDAPGSLADALPMLRRTYCDTIGYEIDHIASPERRQWLRQAIESGRFRQPLSPERQQWLLENLTRAEGLEQFLHKAYLGAKRFSGEGVDAQIPMLELIKERAADAGIGEIVLGMAHRGRLNVLAHTVGLPYETIFAEFEGGTAAESGMIPDGGTGDVKYHLGAHRPYSAPSGATTTVTLLPNPSHLEFIGAPVVGHARAAQTTRQGALAYDTSASLPITLHGDAAFSGQGVVPETLNLANLAGYTTGGTIHIISNNQVGFTTNPVDGRSTHYASDLAKGFDIPIIHVNADDPEACLAAADLAFAWRQQFHADLLIDLVGYRRHGHNEGDEPAFTQPTMYALVKAHPTIRQLYGEQLAARGTLPAAEVDALAERVYQQFISIQDGFRRALADKPPRAPVPPVVQAESDVSTGVPDERLRALNEQLLTLPEGFTINPKLGKLVLDARRDALDQSGGIAWAHAEALAFASLVTEGTPIRLTGQDVGRGTFANRHAVLHDTTTGARAIPLQHLPGAAATFEIHNSPLSELACIGFEYGYGVAVPEALVIWEAQYGDFVNGAQVMIDQFISSSLSKWGETSRLTILLPHGQEGGGPEHSSGRVERFLQLAAEGNIRVANATTAAQYFHLLRRQAHWDLIRPLVVMTPKSMLRDKLAGSSLDELIHGRFHTVLDDPQIGDRAATAHRLLLCSGKVYFELLKGAEKAGRVLPPIARVEQLYPLPGDALRELLGRYPALTEVVWVQEEPRNMGAWNYMAPCLRELLPEGVALRYIGRPDRASPAEGYARSSDQAHERILQEALGGEG